MNNPKLILVALFVPFLAWRYYSRIKRLVGRQLFFRNRLLVVGLFLVFALVLAGLVAATSLRLGEALAGGALVGALLAFLGLKLTRFELLPQGKFYTPNAWLGISVLALFIGRLIYRLIVLYAAPSDQPPTLGAGQSALTLFFFGLSAGYYAAYNLGLVWKFKNAEPIEKTAN